MSGFCHLNNIRVTCRVTIGAHPASLGPIGCCRHGTTHRWRRRSRSDHEWSATHNRTKRELGHHTRRGRSWIFREKVHAACGRRFEATNGAQSRFWVLLWQKRFSIRPYQEQIRIGRAPLVVIGGIHPRGQTVSGRDQEDTVFIPLRSARQRIHGLNRPNANAVNLLYVQVDIPSPSSRRASSSFRTFAGPSWPDFRSKI